MASSSEADDKQNIVGNKLEINYQKSPQYRTIHADGAHGGLTSRGYISLTLYNERNVIPRKSEREVLEADEENHLLRLSGEKVTDGLNGIMRQLEATVFLNLDTAQELYQWLRNRVGELEDFMETPADQRVTKPVSKNDSGKDQ